MPTQPAEHPLPRLVSVQSAAESLGISRAQLYKLLHRGEVQSVHIGTRCLVPTQALDRFVAQLVGDAS